jgi:hypothetical protein
MPYVCSAPGWRFWLELELRAYSLHQRSPSRLALSAAEAAPVREPRARGLGMKWIAAVVLSAGMACIARAQLPPADAVRVREFYRLAPAIEDQLWPGWSAVPSPVLLVTGDTEYLVRFPAPPKDFRAEGDSVWTRPRQLPTGFQATAPIFGPPAVIVIGEPSKTDGKTSTPWEIVMMHEHFHQLQDAQPGYFEAVAKLGLDGGDNTGMWMLNYAFPYADPQVVQGFNALRDQLLTTVGEPDGPQFKRAAATYIAMRRRFFGRLAPNDRKYLSFQLWQEGIARYTQIRAAEAAAGYQPTAEYKKLPDYESFAEYAPKLRAETLAELRSIDIATAKRIIVYSFGGVEGLLLDRMRPAWKPEYFRHMLTTEPLFER